jgi:hypothetical protein
MPNRILREGILTSPRMAKLGWAEEVFYRRLISVVDDFGRYYADAGMLRAACYPRQLSKVSDSDIGKWLQIIADAGLVRAYQVSGEGYLEVLDFGQQVRAKKSKFPDMQGNCVADAEQPLANEHLGVFGVVSVSEGERPRASRLSPEWSLPDEWRAWARTERPDLDVAKTADDFRDYWHAKSGKDATKLDWLATWRKWVRNERMKPQDIKRATAPAPPPSTFLAEQAAHLAAVRAERAAKQAKEQAA